MDKAHSGIWDYFFIYYNLIPIIDSWAISEAPVAQECLLSSMVYPTLKLRKTIFLYSCSI